MNEALHRATVGEGAQPNKESFREEVVQRIMTLPEFQEYLAVTVGAINVWRMARHCHTLHVPEGVQRALINSARSIDTELQIALQHQLNKRYDLLVTYAEIYEAGKRATHKDQPSANDERDHR